jgi:dihydroflavonol-4-reductase
VRLLLEKGEAVRVLVRDSSDERPLANLDVERVTGDVRCESDVRRAMRGVDCVVHSAALLHIGKTNLGLSRAINVEGTRNVVTASQEAGARMVHVSTVDTMGVGRPGALASEEQQFGEKVPTSYSISKREAEQLVEAAISAGLNGIIVHPVFMVGPWDWKPSSGRMLLAIAQRFTPLAPSGGHTVADARDVAQGIISALETGRRGEHYILGGHPISYLDFWKLCAEVSGGRGPFGRLGPVNRIVAGWGGDLWARLTGQEGDVNSASLGVSSQWHYYTSEKAERELSYRYRPIRESVEVAWEWFREYGYVGAK